MKNFNIILALVVFMLYCSGCCKYREGLPFYIQNDSDQEIIVTKNLNQPIPREDGCLKHSIKFLTYYSMIRPYSKRNFEGLRESFLEKSADTLHIGVFYLVDIDTMSCEEFEQLFPIKKEWEVTLEDMEACDWTLVYTPD